MVTCFRPEFFMDWNAELGNLVQWRASAAKDATEVKCHFKKLKVRERHFCNKKRLNENFLYPGGGNAPPCYPVAGPSSGFRCRGDQK